MNSSVFKNPNKKNIIIYWILRLCVEVPFRILPCLVGIIEFQTFILSGFFKTQEVSERREKLKEQTKRKGEM